MSFTLLLFTRSLHDRGGSKEDKCIQLLSTCEKNHVVDQLDGIISQKACTQIFGSVTWVSGVRSCLSVELWPAMTGTQEAAAPPSTTRWAEKSSACSDRKALLQTGPSGSEMPHPPCPGESGGEIWQQGLNYNKRWRRMCNNCSISEMMKLLCDVMCKCVMWCFSPPARPGSTACHPLAPLWPVEAHLSSGVTVQSEAETQRQSAHLKSNDSNTNMHFLARFWVVCVCLCVCAHKEQARWLDSRRLRKFEWQNS